MASINDLGFAPKWMLKYIHSELSKYEEMEMTTDGEMMPFFPTAPTNVEEVYNNLLQTFPIGEPLMIQWDRLMRFRPNPFYVHKREQLLLFLYSTNFEKMHGANIIISQALDREDVSASEVNKWLSNNRANLEPTFGELNVFFRSEFAER
jgi:hypothetical protein